MHDDAKDAKDLLLHINLKPGTSAQGQGSRARACTVSSASIWREIAGEGVIVAFHKEMLCIYLQFKITHLELHAVICHKCICQDSHSLEVHICCIFKNLSS